MICLQLCVADNINNICTGLSAAKLLLSYYYYDTLWYCPLFIILTPHTVQHWNNCNIRSLQAIWANHVTT